MSVNIEYVGNNSRPSVSRDKYIGLVWGMTAVPVGTTTETIIEIFSKDEITAKVFVEEDSTLIENKLLYYHLSSIFEISPNAVVQLYLTTAITVAKLNVFDPKTQLLGYFAGTQATNSAGVTALINSVQTKLLDMLAVNNKPVVAVVSVGLKNIAYSALPNFETNGTANLVMLDCAQDYSDNSLAKQVYTDNSELCGSIGLILGSLTKKFCSASHWRSYGEHTDPICEQCNYTD